MIQWIGIGLTIVGMAYNGWRQYQQMPMLPPQVIVQESYAQPQPIMTWQVAFNPNSGKLYHLHPDGKWHEQVPQIRTNPTQYPPGMGIGQGSQPPQVGEWIARQPSQASTNPWFR